MTLAELREKAERDGGAFGRVGVMVSALQDRKSGRGTRFFRMTISDPTLTVSGMALFPEDFEALAPRVRANLTGGDDARGSLQRWRVRPRRPFGWRARGRGGRRGDMSVRVFIDAAEGVGSVKTLLDRYRDDAAVKGRGEVRLAPLGVPVGEVDIELGDGWPMTPEIKSALKSLPGVAAVEDVV